MAAEAGPPRLARAGALLDIGRVEAARREIAAVLAEEPRNAEALCLLARTYIGQGGPAVMHDAARRAIEADPEHFEGHVMLAYAHLGRRDWAATRTSALEGIRLQPDTWRGHGALAAAELGLVHPRAALRAAARAVAIAPQLAAVHVVQGTVFATVWRKGSARKAYRRALALDPQHVGALTRLSRDAAGRVRLAEAARYVGAALPVAPNDRDVHRQVDRLFLAGFGGWGIAAVWAAGVLGTFVAFPWVWAVALLLPVAWAVQAGRGWRALSPALRDHARRLLRGDARARVRVAGLALCALTAAALTAAGSVQDPGGDPSAWLIVPAGAHLLSVVIVAVAIRRADAREKP